MEDMLQRRPTRAAAVAIVLCMAFAAGAQDDTTRSITPGFNNWLMFSAMVEAALLALVSGSAPV